MEIVYKKGDATAPIEEGPKVIIHCCNNIGAWGAGFVLALSRRWPETRSNYIKWSKGYAKHEPKYELGNVQFVPVEEDIWVGNMLGQEGIRSKNSIAPIRYSAIVSSLWKVREFCQSHNCRVVCPKFGSGLAGGDWKIIEKYLRDILCDSNIPVTVYEF